MAELGWQQQDATLKLTGCLEKQTLNALWEKREALFSAVDFVNISRLAQMDSAGLALLVNCCLTFNVKLIGVKAQQAILIKLYNLEEVME